MRGYRYYLAFVDTTEKARVVVQSVVDSLVMLDARLATLRALRDESMPIRDALGQIRNARLDEQVVFTDAQQLSSSHLLADLLPPLDRSATSVERLASILNTLSMTDQAARKRLETVRDTLRVLDSEGKSRRSILADALLPVDAVIKRLEAVRRDVIGLVDRVDLFLERRLELADSLALLDRTTRALQRYVVEAVGLSDAERKVHERRLAEAAVLLDALLQRRDLVMLDAVLLADRSLRERSAFLMDSLAVADSLAAYRERRQSVLDSAAVLDQTLRTAEYRIAETVGLSDARQAALAAVLSDTAALVEQVVQERQLRILDATPLLDSATALYLQATVILTRLVTDQAALTDLLTEAHARFLRETLGQTDAFVSVRGLLVADPVGLLDQLARQTERPLTLSDVMPLTDRLVHVGQKLIADTLRSQDANVLERLLTIPDLTATLADLLVVARMLGRLAEDRVGLRVNADLSFTKVLLEAVGLPDLERRLIQKVLIDAGTLNLIDAVTRLVEQQAGLILSVGITTLSARSYYHPAMGASDRFGRRMRVVEWFNPSASTHDYFSERLSAGHLFAPLTSIENVRAVYG